MRATTTCYGKTKKIDFIEVVIHNNNGKIMKKKIIDGSEDLDKSTDKIVNFCKENNVEENIIVEGVIKPEKCPCGCGEWLSRVTTDDDLGRKNNENNVEIIDKLRRFFEISSLICSHCGKFGCLEDNYKKDEIKITKTPEYYGIITKEDWKIKMDEYIKWIFENKNEVLKVLPNLENEWKETCKSVRLLLNENNIQV